MAANSSSSSSVQQTYQDFSVQGPACNLDGAFDFNRGAGVRGVACPRPLFYSQQPGGANKAITSASAPSAEYFFKVGAYDSEKPCTNFVHFSPGNSVAYPTITPNTDNNDVLMWRVLRDTPAQPLTAATIGARFNLMKFYILPCANGYFGNVNGQACSSDTAAWGADNVPLRDGDQIMIFTTTQYGTQAPQNFAGFPLGIMQATCTQINAAFDSTLLCGTALMQGNTLFGAAGSFCSDYFLSNNLGSGDGDSSSSSSAIPNAGAAAVAKYGNAGGVARQGFKQVLATVLPATFNSTQFKNATTSPTCVDSLRPFSVDTDVDPCTEKPKDSAPGFNPAVMMVVEGRARLGISTAAASSGGDSTNQTQYSLKGERMAIHSGTFFKSLSGNKSATGGGGGGGATGNSNQIGTVATTVGPFAQLCTADFAGNASATSPSAAFSQVANLFPTANGNQYYPCVPVVWVIRKAAQQLTSDAGGGMQANTVVAAGGTGSTAITSSFLSRSQRPTSSSLNHVQPRHYQQQQQKQRETRDQVVKHHEMAERYVPSATVGADPPPRRMVQPAHLWIAFLGGLVVLGLVLALFHHITKRGPKHILLQAIVGFCCLTIVLAVFEGWHETADGDDDGDSNDDGSSVQAAALDDDDPLEPTKDTSTNPSPAAASAVPSSHAQSLVASVLTARRRKRATRRQQRSAATAAARPVSAALRDNVHAHFSLSGMWDDIKGALGFGGGSSSTSGASAPATFEPTDGSGGLLRCDRALVCEGDSFSLEFSGYAPTLAADNAQIPMWFSNTASRQAFFQTYGLGFADPNRFTKLQPANFRQAPNSNTSLSITGETYDPASTSFSPNSAGVLWQQNLLVPTGNGGPWVDTMPMKLAFYHAFFDPLNPSQQLFPEFLGMGPFTDPDQYAYYCGIRNFGGVGYTRTENGAGAFHSASLLTFLNTQPSSTTTTTTLTLGSGGGGVGYTELPATTLFADPATDSPHSLAPFNQPHVVGNALSTTFYPALTNGLGPYHRLQRAVHLCTRGPGAGGTVGQSPSSGEGEEGLIDPLPTAVASMPLFTQMMAHVNALNFLLQGTTTVSLATDRDVIDYYYNVPTRFVRPRRVPLNGTISVSLPTALAALRLPPFSASSSTSAVSNGLCRSHKTQRFLWLQMAVAFGASSGTTTFTFAAYDLVNLLAAGLPEEAPPLPGLGLDLWLGVESSVARYSSADVPGNRFGYAVDDMRRALVQVPKALGAARMTKALPVNVVQRLGGLAQYTDPAQPLYAFQGTVSELGHQHQMQNLPLDNFGMGVQFNNPDIMAAPIVLTGGTGSAPSDTFYDRDMTTDSKFTADLFLLPDDPRRVWLQTTHGCGPNAAWDAGTALASGTTSGGGGGLGSAGPAANDLSGIMVPESATRAGTSRDTFTNLSTTARSIGQLNALLGPCGAMPQIFFHMVGAPSSMPEAALGNGGIDDDEATLLNTLGRFQTNDPLSDPTCSSDSDCTDNAVTNGNVKCIVTSNGTRHCRNPNFNPLADAVKTTSWTLFLLVIFGILLLVLVAMVVRYRSHSKNVFNQILATTTQQTSAASASSTPPAAAATPSALSPLPPQPSSSSGVGNGAGGGGADAALAAASQVVFSGSSLAPLSSSLPAPVSAPTFRRMYVAPQGASSS